MKDFIVEFLGGTFIGILVGILISVVIFIYYSGHYLNKHELKKALDKNITTKELFWNCYPEEYKMNYTDWKTIRNIGCPNKNI